MTLQKRLPRPVKRVCTARRAGAFGPDKAGRLRSIDRVKVKLPDGNELELEEGASGADAAAAIGPGLARAALAVRHDGEQRGLLSSVGESLDLRAPVALALLHRSVDVGADVDVVLPGGAVAGRVVDLPMLDPVDTGMSGA